jgi:hypothetical protein
MEAITNAQDQSLLDYLDGALATNERQLLEEQMKSDPALIIRLEELLVVHRTLKKSKLESPSRQFTARVMANLHRASVSSSLSPRNGLLLLCGMMVAIGVGALFLSQGLFDGMSETIKISPLPMQEKMVKTPLPSFLFDVKWLVKGFLVLNLGLAFIILDRAILRPFFERRTKIYF